MADKKPFVAKHGFAVANSTLTVFGSNGKLHANNTISDATITDAMLASTFTTESTFNSALANTNLAIADRLQVANATLLINDRLQVANAAAIYQTIAVERAALANTNSYIAEQETRIDLVNTNLTGTNTALRTLIDDRIQVANADTRFLRKDGTAAQSVGGQVTFNNNVLISGNLTVSGTKTEVNTTQVNVSNTYILLNSDLGSGTAATENAGIIVNRGAEANVYFRWNETGEYWEYGEADGDFTKISEASTTIIDARNESGGTINFGQPVSISGYSAGGGRPLVELADADDPAQMPALGLALDTVATGNNLRVATYGVVTEANTGVFSAGQELYVDTVAGKLTGTRPTGDTVKVQKIGKVLRPHASAGSIIIQGAGRSNDIPNLEHKHIFIGNTANGYDARQLAVEDISDGDTLATNAALQTEVTRIDLVNTNLTGTNTALRTLISDRLQVANADSKFQTIAIERAALANTNLAIADRLQVANAITTLAGLTDVAQVTPTDGQVVKFSSSNSTFFFAAEAGEVSNAYLTSTFTTNTVFQSALANTNLAIADRLQVANADSKFQTITVERAALANTNLAIADRLQVANAITTFAGLNDVSQVTPTDGQVIKFSTSNSTFFFADADITSTAFQATTANGTQTTFTSPVTTNNPRDLLVTIDGVLQTPVTDYTVSGTTVTISPAPLTDSVIVVRTGSVPVTDQSQTTLQELANVANTTPTDGQIVKFSSANSTFFFAADTGEVSNAYLTSTFTTNTAFQSYVANTNSRLTSLEAGEVGVSNAYLTSTFTTNTVFQSALANTNLAIADRLQVANAAVYLEVANANILKSNTFSFVNPDNYHIYTITVSTKTTAHPYTGQGSGNAYFLDGIESPSIILAPNQTYRFDQSDASNSGHPLLFYRDAAKTVQHTTGITTSGTPGSAGAYTQVVVDEDMPQILYYQCSAHAYMGSVASILSDTSPKYLESSNATSTFQTITVERAALANTNLAIADRLQVANAGVYLEVANAITTLAGLTDVDQVTPTDGHVLTYSSSNTTYYFAAAAGGGGNSFSVIEVGGTLIDSAGSTARLSIDAGSGITLTPTSGNNTIVIGATGGAVTVPTFSDLAVTTFTANGTQTAFGINNDVTGAEDLIVTLDGVIQRPTTDYTFSSNTVTFGIAPINGEIVAIREIKAVGQVSGVTNTDFQSFVANTNLAISDRLQVANATLLINDRLQVANAITTLAGLTDVAQVTPTDGHVLKYSSSNTTYYFAAESGGAGGNSFSVIEIGGTLIDSAGSTARLSIDAGSGITLTPTAGNNTIVISSTGGGANTSISNVAFTTANNNLKILTEDSRTFSVDLSDLSGGGGSISPLTSTATANGTATTFTSPISTTNENEVLVTIDGVLQTPQTDYTISGTTVTFDEAPEINSSIVVRTAAVSSVAAANTSISNVAFTSANSNLKILTEDGKSFSTDLSDLGGSSVSPIAMAMVFG